MCQCVWNNTKSEESKVNAPSPESSKLTREESTTLKTEDLYPTGVIGTQLTNYKTDRNTATCINTSHLKRYLSPSAATIAGKPNYYSNGIMTEDLYANTVPISMIPRNETDTITASAQIKASGPTITENELGANETDSDMDETRTEDLYPNGAAMNMVHRNETDTITTSAQIKPSGPTITEANINDIGKNEMRTQDLYQMSDNDEETNTYDLYPELKDAMDRQVSDTIKNMLGGLHSLNHYQSVPL